MFRCNVRLLQRYAGHVRPCTLPSANVPFDPEYLSFLIAWIKMSRFQAVAKDRNASMQRNVAEHLRRLATTYSTYQFGESRKIKFQNYKKTL